MSGNKTKLTPAEFSNTVQALQEFDNVGIFSDAAVAAAEVLMVKVIRQPLSLEEIIFRAGNCGSASATQIDVKKNGVSVLAAVLTIDNADPDGTVVVGAPDTDAHAKFDPGDVLTIESGTSGTNAEDISVECRLAKRYDPQASIPAIIGGSVG